MFGLDQQMWEMKCGLREVFDNEMSMTARPSYQSMATGTS
jgi:hypothetical protein